MGEIVAAFVASVFFSILFNVDKGSLILGGLVGTVGWISYKFSLMRTDSSALALFIASLAVAFLSEIAARRFKKPATVVMVPGIVTLVPGALAYYAMLHFVKGEYNLGLATGAETMFSAGAIAAGLALVTVIFRVGKIREGDGID